MFFLHKVTEVTVTLKDYCTPQHSELKEQAM